MPLYINQMVVVIMLKKSNFITVAKNKNVKKKADNQISLMRI